MSDFKRVTLKSGTVILNKDEQARTAQRKNRIDIVDLVKDGTLSTATAEQNFAKYGMKMGDYFGGSNVPSGYDYILADPNTFFGNYNNMAVVSTPHVGILVNTHKTVQWNTSNTTATGYAGSNIHSFLSGEALNNIKADIASLTGDTATDHLLAHSKLYTNATSSWDWSANQYISALTECQMYGANVWSIDGYSTGEAYKQLEVFREHNQNELFGNYPGWLRSVCSSSLACYWGGDGRADSDGAGASLLAVGLILYK